MSADFAARRETLQWLAAAAAFAVPSLSRGAPQEFSALLIGVTEYDNKSIPRLKGPPNDIEWVRRRLMEMGYAPERIVTLANGPGAPPKSLPPTGANIRAALEQVARTAAPGKSLWLHYCGHGAQTPSFGPTGRNNEEPDGLDEVLLPSDTLKWSGRVGGVTNAIRDDDIGKYLDAIRARGMNVFAVFDCCYANTMTKAEDLPGVTYRCVEPEALGIPLAVMSRLPAQPKETRRNRMLAKGEAAMAAAGGAMVTLYATREDQRAPEMLLSPGDGPDRTYGALTWAVCRALSVKSTRTMRRLFDGVVSQQVQLNGVPRPLLADDGQVADKLPFAQAAQ